MEIRVIEISNGYLVYSDMSDQPVFRHEPENVKDYVEKLIKEWVVKEIQKENK